MFTPSTRVPVRVALPVAHVAVRRVQAPRTVRTAAPVPLARSRASIDRSIRPAHPVCVARTDPLKTTWYIQRRLNPG